MEIRARPGATSAVLRACRRHRRPEFSSSYATVPESIREQSTGHAGSREDAEKSSAALALPPWLQASIPRFRVRETGTAVAGQISNRVSGSWQFVALSGHH